MPDTRTRTNHQANTTNAAVTLKIQLSGVISTILGNGVGTTEGGSGKTLMTLTKPTGWEVVAGSNYTYSKTISSGLNASITDTATFTFAWGEAFFSKNPVQITENDLTTEKSASGTRTLDAIVKDLETLKTAMTSDTNKLTATITASPTTTTTA